jgi:hypothetical protein
MMALCAPCVQSTTVQGITLGFVNTIIKNPDMVSFMYKKTKGKSVYPDQILPFFAARERHDIEFRSHQRGDIHG